MPLSTAQKSQVTQFTSITNSDKKVAERVSSLLQDVPFEEKLGVDWFGRTMCKAKAAGPLVGSREVEDEEAVATEQ